MTDEAWLTEFWRLAEVFRCAVRSREYYAAKEALAHHLVPMAMGARHNGEPAMDRLWRGFRASESWRAPTFCNPPAFDSDEHD